MAPPSLLSSLVLDPTASITQAAQQPGATTESVWRAVAAATAEAFNNQHAHRGARVTSGKTAGRLTAFRGACAEITDDKNAKHTVALASVRHATATPPAPPAPTATPPAFRTTTR